MIKAVLTTMPFFTSLFWGVLILLSSKKQERSKRALALFMLVTSILYLCHCAYFNGEIAIIPFTDTTYSFVTLAVFPLYYYYIILITSEENLSFRQYLLLFPSLICCIGICITYVLMPSADRTIWITEYLSGVSSLDSSWIELQRIIHKTVSVCFGLVIIPVAWFGTKRISLYNKTISNYYSNVEGKTLKRISIMMNLFITTSLIAATANFLGKAFFVYSQQLLMIPSAIFSILIFLLGYIGFNQEFTVKNFNLERENDKEYESGKENLLYKMVQLMDNKKLYLKPDLKITDLASILCTNRTYISKTINQELGISFCEWINKYRVEYAKQLLDESKETKSKVYMKDILIQSGFVSEASFFRIFKQFTGLSPRSWMER